mmetsp:Transcript_4294/g.13472  ORF Transcript_4294/g.13472 Transcript_4294/m.13472 type:complete len:543 (+) Transcript_4294:970-2598(+)
MDRRATHHYIAIWDLGEHRPMIITTLSIARHEFYCHFDWVFKAVSKCEYSPQSCSENMTEIKIRSIYLVNKMPITTSMWCRWLEFDEFRHFYVTHLGGDDALERLRTRIKIRFRSKGEIMAIAEERASLQRRAKFKAELEARREVNRAVKERQRNRMVDVCYRDCDGHLRQSRAHRVREVEKHELNDKSEEIADTYAAIRRMRRAVARSRKQRSSANWNLSFLEMATTMQIATHRRAFPACALNRESVLQIEGSLAVYNPTTSTRRSSQNSDLDFLTDVTIKLESTRSAHPAMWENFMTSRKGPSISTSPQPVKQPLQHSCHICVGDQHGCPCCYEVPGGLKLNEYSYMPGDMPAGDVPYIAGELLHTDLTTRVALEHDRRIRHDPAEVLFKSVPCGAMLRVWVLCDYTIRHLHHLFRSASLHGIDDLTSFYLPTESGLVEMNMESGQGFSSNCGIIPLFRYGINKCGARAVVFHGCHVSMSSMICKFVRSNLFVENYPATLKLVSHLDDSSAAVLGADMIQIGLWNIFIERPQPPARGHEH